MLLEVAACKLFRLSSHKDSYKENVLLPSSLSVISGVIFFNPDGKTREYHRGKFITVKHLEET